MVDMVTRDKWMAQFCLLIANGNDFYDSTLFVTKEHTWFNDGTTAALWWAYHDGRVQEREEIQKAALSFITVPVVSSTDWQSVNAVARSTE